MKHFISADTISLSELKNLLTLAKTLKADIKLGKKHAYLQGKTLGMIFEKPSNRTRVSFEVGMYQLGGHALYIQNSDIGMGSRESVADTARVLSRFVDGVMIRANFHTMIDEFAHYSTVPVINGLSDLQHPCQALADILTIQEHKGSLQDLKIVYVGDGNNVCQSLIELAEPLGARIVVACPKGFEPKLKPNSTIHIEADPQKAVENADVVYTDVWISMGQEAETESKLKQFKSYAITQKLLRYASPKVIFMHCLPAHRGQEVDHDVMESPHSVVFDQAENRLHAQKAILINCFSQ